MQLGEGHRVVTIASGGCNILAYLTRSPASIDAVDLNKAHIALNRMKLAAFRHLPSHADLFRFFGETGNRHNSAAYDQFIAPNLDAASRRYWEKRSWRGKRRIAVFEKNFYRTGMLGLFIGIGHIAARLYGVNPADIMKASGMREQRRFFEEAAGAAVRPPPDPLDHVDEIVAVRARHPAGAIRRAGRRGRRRDGARPVDAAGKARLPLSGCKDNYFAWQAFARRYPAPARPRCPPISKRRTIQTIRANVGRVDIHHRNIVELLKGQASRQRRPLHPARRAGLDERPAAERSVDRDHPHRGAGCAGDFPHGRRSDAAARPARRRRCSTGGTTAKPNRSTSPGATARRSMAASIST